jgi:DNA polymerase (family 10)
MQGHNIPNKEVITKLKEVVAAMEVKNYNRFRIAAYGNAIAVLENYSESLYDMWQNGRLNQIPGLGASLINHLNELFKTGAVKQFDSALKDLPQGMFSLLALRGVGPKKAFKLSTQFGLDRRETAIEKLKKIARQNKIQDLEGFGEKSEAQILEAIEESYITKSEKTRVLYTNAESIVEQIYRYMKKLPEVIEIEATGSYRRKNPTIGDLDIPVSTTNQKKTLDHFLKYPKIQKVLVAGKKRTSVLLKNNMQVDLYVCAPEEYGSMLQYFTGSKQHNILLRNYAIDHKMSLSEYGIKTKDSLIKTSSEKEFYEYLNMSLIPPVLREGNNEIEAALKNELPKLIEMDDLKGDLHSHTDFSDGISSLEEMAKEAIKKGYEYFGITDHAPSVMSRGYGNVLRIVEDAKRAIAKFNYEQDDIKILFGYEVNILANGEISLPDEILKNLDYAIGGIHTAYRQNKEQITDRLLSAIQNPYINIIAHPSNRILNERDPADPDWDVVFKAAKDHDKVLEINSQPDRLDLPYDLVKLAVEREVKLVISSDAHSTAQLDYIKYGINTAQKGWAKKENILNTQSLSEITQQLNLR